MDDLGRIMQMEESGRIMQMAESRRCHQVELPKIMQMEESIMQMAESRRRHQKELAKFHQEELSNIVQMAESRRFHQEELPKFHQEELPKRHQKELAKFHQEELSERHQKELAKFHQEELSERHQKKIAKFHQKELSNIVQMAESRRLHQEELPKCHQKELAKFHQEELSNIVQIAECRSFHQEEPSNIVQMAESRSFHQEEPSNIVQMAESRRRHQEELAKIMQMAERSIPERKEQHMQEREREEEQHSSKGRRRQQSTPERDAKVSLITRTCSSAPRYQTQLQASDGPLPLLSSSHGLSANRLPVLSNVHSIGQYCPNAEGPEGQQPMFSPPGKGLHISIASEPGHRGPSSMLFSGGYLASSLLSQGNVTSNVSGSPNCDEPPLRSIWTENCGQDCSVQNDSENTPHVWASSYDIPNTSTVHLLLPELKATNVVESNEHTEHSEQPFFSKLWQFEQAFSYNGGNLQASNSDIILVIPEAAVRQGSNIVIKGAVSTNLERVHRDLDMREDERIVSAVIEYTAGPDAVFEKPVTISIPHFIPGNPPYDGVCVYWFHKDGSGLHDQKLNWKMSEETTGDTDTGPDNGVFRFSGSDRIEVLVTHFCGFVCTHCGESSPQLQLRLYGSPCGQNDKDVKIFLLVWDNRLDSKDFRENIVQKPEEDQKYILTQTITDVPENANDLKLGAILTMEPQYELVWMHKLRPGGLSPWFPAKQEIDLRKYHPSCMKSSPKRLEWLLTRRKMTAPTFACFIEVGFLAAEEEHSTFLDGLDIATLHIEQIKLRAEKPLASCCTQTDKDLIQKNQAKASSTQTDQFAFDQPPFSSQPQASSSINGQLHEQVKQACPDVRPKVRHMNSTSDQHESQKPEANNSCMGNHMSETTRSAEIQQCNNNNQPLTCSASSSQTHRKSVHAGLDRESAESEDENCNTSSDMNGNSQWHMCREDGREPECSGNKTLLDSAGASAVASGQSSPADAHSNNHSGQSLILIPFLARPKNLAQQYSEQPIAYVQCTVNNYDVKASKIRGDLVHIGPNSVSPAPGTSSSNVQYPADVALTNDECMAYGMRRLALNSPDSYHNFEMMPSTSGPHEEAVQQEHHQPTASRGLSELRGFSFSPAVQCSDSSLNNTY